MYESSVGMIVSWSESGALPALQSSYRTVGSLKNRPASDWAFTVLLSWVGGIGSDEECSGGWASGSGCVLLSWTGVFGSVEMSKGDSSGVFSVFGTITSWGPKPRSSLEANTSLSCSQDTSATADGITRILKLSDERFWMADVTSTSYHIPFWIVFKLPITMSYSGAFLQVTESSVQSEAVALRKVAPLRLDPWITCIKMLAYSTMRPGMSELTSKLIMACISPHSGGLNSKRTSDPNDLSWSLYTIVESPLAYVLRTDARSKLRFWSGHTGRLGINPSPSSLSLES